MNIEYRKILEKRLKKGIANNKFVIYLQPKFYTKTEELAGAEALVRWNRDGDVVMPNIFVPLLEKYELITELDTYVLESICKLQQNWEKKGYKIFPISVNESRLHLYNKNHINDLIDFVNKYILYNTPTGFVLYIILILFFGYFYTFMVMNPDEMSKNLNERGGYIPGIRPGEDTSNYISNSMGKLTLVGSIFLVILAAIPIIFSLIFGLSSQVTIGGTGMLIVVGVAIETYKQMESSLVSRSYTAKRKRLR